MRFVDRLASRLNKQSSITEEALPPQVPVRLRLEPLSVAVSSAEPVRINILVPTLITRHLFAGASASYGLAARMADRGARVRIVATDLSDPPDEHSRLLAGHDLPGSDWTEKIEHSSGYPDLFERIEVFAAGGRDQPMPVSPDDRFVATTPITANLAAEATVSTDEERFLFLIQEYNPILGADWLAAIALQSYRLPHIALYSTELLAEYFEGEKVGSFSHEAGSESFVFRNPITQVRRPEAGELQERKRRSLAFYARPEPHARRNLIELGLLAIERALADGLLPLEWEINGIGAVSETADIPVGPDSVVKMTERMPVDRYAKWLEGHDVGLSLMLTPHPSLPPLEFAASGASTVTTVFANKTAERLSEISPNLFGVEPGIEQLAVAIGEAVKRRDAFAERAAGARFDWPSDWSAALPDALIDSLFQAVKYDPGP